MVGQIARDPATQGLPLSGIGGISTWRDAAEYMALGCGTVQVCTATMVYGFKIIDELKSGLEAWMDEKGHPAVKDFVGRPVPRFTECHHPTLTYLSKPR